MAETPLRQVKATSPLMRVAWLSVGAICLFAVENVWIDPWVARRSHHRLPSFVPDALGGAWFLVLLVLGIALILAIFCQVMLTKDTVLARWTKLSTGMAVLVAVILAGEWFVATGGMALMNQKAPPKRDHSVTLRWQASPTKHVQYNIYRGTKPGVHPDKVNSAPIDGLTFVDTTVENGMTYYYVVRTIDATGKESSDSAEIATEVP